MKELKKADRAVAKAVRLEEKRQIEGMELIASENYVSPAVREALGSVFTNKYSEGYPQKRYYGGQEYTDMIESLAIKRAKKLFGVQHVNVQPHSGAPANLAVYAALLEPGDTVLGMDLSHGGHLTHGHPMTLPSKIYNFVRYKTEANGKIDYDKLKELAKKEKPKLILAGFSSYSRQLNYRKFREIAKEVGAVTMIDIAHIAGLIAGKVISSPVPYFDVITTTTHKTLRGPRGGMIMCRKEFAKAIDKQVFPGIQGGPHMHTIAAKAVAFGEALKPLFARYSKQILVNAKILEEELRKRNFCLCFGGRTENHMMLLDMIASRGISGKEAEEALDFVGITVNKNIIPDDERKPLDPSGIRIGVPAVTTRGMKENEMKKIARWIDETLDRRRTKKEMLLIKKEVTNTCKKFPTP